MSMPRAAPHAALIANARTVRIRVATGRNRSGTTTAVAASQAAYSTSAVRDGPVATTDNTAAAASSKTQNSGHPGRTATSGRNTRATHTPTARTRSNGMEVPGTCMYGTAPSTAANATKIDFGWTAAT
jgi:hypothetical protein